MKSAKIDRPEHLRRDEGRNPGSVRFRTKRIKEASGWLPRIEHTGSQQMTSSKNNCSRLKSREKQELTLLTDRSVAPVIVEADFENFVANS